MTPITALGADLPRCARFGPLTLTETPGLALASLALRRGTAAPALFGLTLPSPGGWVAGAGVAAFWTGPGQWMIEAEGRAEHDFAAEVKRAAPGCSVTEQTDGWVAIEIASSAGADPLIRLMEKLVNVDAATFGPGRATRTALEHMGVFLIRRAEDRLAVLGMRSAAGSLWHALETAASRLARPG
nr:sarcosine oxidase subunit gamma [Rhodovulum strictum]